MEYLCHHFSLWQNISEADWEEFCKNEATLSIGNNLTTVETLHNNLTLPGSPPGTMTTGDPEMICQNLKEVMKSSYGNVHGYICLFICIFGAIANLLNIIVLTRKEMNGSPINRILTGTCQMHFLRFFAIPFNERNAMHQLIRFFTFEAQKITVFGAENNCFHCFSR